jgi:hypothetical protein
VREREIGVFLVRSLGLEACMQGKTLTMGFFWGNNIPCLPKQREGETTHQKEAKNDRMLPCPRKRTKQKRESERDE